LIFAVHHRGHHIAAGGLAVQAQAGLKPPVERARVKQSKLCLTEKSDEGCFKSTGYRPS
jgi:hypothetical protein